ERRGHGRTRDSEGSFHYADMAEDMAALMDAMKIPRARMAGYSDGANLIFYLAMRYPEKVEGFVSLAGNFHYSGCDPEHRAELEKVPAGRLSEEGIDRRYARVSPDGPDHYVEVYHKAIRLWLTEPDLTPADLRKIKAPALIAAGDHDVVLLEHTKELYRSLSRARLEIVPGASHRLIKENPELINRIVLDFLESAEC
ncbi:MAG: hypothetical protein A2Z83_06180, partial [Omnitrophica bacterium GWA2_52_8]